MQRSTTLVAGLVPPVSPARVWAAAVAIYALLIPTHLIPPSGARVLSDLAWTVAAVVATVSSYRAARALSGANRAAWLLFAAAAAAWAAGQIAWDVYELVLNIPTPFPSVADLGYFGFGVLMIAGVIVLRSTQKERRLTWLRVANLGLIVCGLAVILIGVLTQPFIRSTLEFGAALTIVSESAASTVACIISMYVLWSYPWGARLTSTALMTAALVLHTVAGVFYTREIVAEQYSVTSAFNILWLMAFALQDCAARSRLAVARGRDDGYSQVLHEKQGWVEALLPSSLLLCMAVSAAGTVEELTQQMIYLGAIMLGLFAVVLSLREALLYSRGQLTQARLDRVTSELRHTTEQVHALDEQRATLERETEITSRAGGVGLWDWDLKSAVRYSREWKHQLGYAEHELADDINEWRVRLHPDDRERINRAVAKFAANPHGEFVEEQRLLHRDGSYRWILTRGAVLRDATGKPQRMLGSHVDITDRKAVELSLRESESRYRDLANELETRVAARTSELTDAYRESRDFAYAVAHDLKAPLRAIDGFSHLLSNSASSRLSEEEQTYIKRVRNGAIKMAALIDGLLDYSRIEHRELRLAPIDCRDVIKDVLQSMEAVIHAAGATVSITIEPVQVCADVEGLRIVFRNLLDNALKFRNPTRPPHVDIGSYQIPGCVVLTIRDNGIGFEQQYRDKIFEIFNRLHARGYEGTGMGLALVRKAIQRMHGRIWAESELDQGSTFYISLPNACHADI